MPRSSTDQLPGRTVEFEGALVLQFPDGLLTPAIRESRHEVAAAAALIAIEHAAALRVAAKAGAMNSAAATLRLQYAAVLRSSWLLFAAGPGQVDKLAKALDLEAEQAAKNVPGYLDMLSAVERAAPAGLALPIAEFNRYSRHALNSFVHAGIHPLTRIRNGFPVDLADAVFRRDAAFRVPTARDVDREPRSHGTGDPRVSRVCRLLAHGGRCVDTQQAVTLE